MLRDNSTLEIASHPAYFMVISAQTAGVHVATAQTLLVRPGWSYTLACSVGAKPSNKPRSPGNSGKPRFGGSSARSSLLSRNKRLSRRRLPFY